MEYIQGKPRSQIVLIESSLEEKIEQDNPVRIIDAFVNWESLASPMPGMLRKADHPMIRVIF
jgi:hypothetical protein